MSYVHLIFYLQCSSLCLLHGRPPPVHRPAVFLSPKNKPQILFWDGGENLGVQLLPIDFQIALRSQSLLHPHFWMYLVPPSPGSLAVLLCKELSCFLAFPAAVCVGTHVSQASQVSASHTDTFRVPTLRCRSSPPVLFDLVDLCLKKKPKTKKHPTTNNQPATVLYRQEAEVNAHLPSTPLCLLDRGEDFI